MSSEEESLREQQEVEDEPDPEAGGKRKSKRMEQVNYPKVPDSVFRSKDTVVGFDNIDFDYSAQQGQARPFSKVTYEQRLQELTEALPTGLVRVTLWPADALGMPLVQRRASSLLPSLYRQKVHCAERSTHHEGADDPAQGVDPRTRGCQVARMSAPPPRRYPLP